MSLPRCYSIDATGRILGLDLSTFIQFSMACGHSMDTVSELLAEANSGFLTALKEAQDEGDTNS